MVSKTKKKSRRVKTSTVSPISRKREVKTLVVQKRMKDIKIGATEYDDAEVITGYQYIVMRGKK